MSENEENSSSSIDTHTVNNANLVSGTHVEIIEDHIRRSTPEQFSVRNV